MKILMLSAFFPPTLGGIESHVYELSKHLVKAGHQVTVIARYIPGKKPERAVEKVNGVKVIWLESKQAAGAPAVSKIVNSPLYWGPILKAWMKGIKLALKQDFDVIHAHSIIPIGIIGVIIKKLMKKPLVITVHESHFLYGLSSRAYSFLARKTLNAADKIICVSGEIQEKVIKLTKRKDIQNISNGVDIEKFYQFSSDIIYKKCRISKKKKIVLCARRLDAPKNGIIYLINAIPHVIEKAPNTHFVFIGRGLEYSTIQQMIPKYSKNVSILGPIPNQDMNKYYNSAQIVVLPSLYEATSIAGLEAMVCGKVLVGTRVGGIPELITDKTTGFLCEPKNPTDLADKIVTAVKSNMHKIGKASRKKVLEGFSWQIIAKKTELVYGGAIRK
jgi:glycosyltransferase involved in cell wall biosynthesis